MVTLQLASAIEQRAEFMPLASTLKALSDPLRLTIVALLAQREHCVCDLMTTLALPQSTCSYHLGVLKRAGLVQDRRGEDARWAYYTLVPATAAALREQVDRLLSLDNFDPTPANCE